MIDEKVRRIRLNESNRTSVRPEPKKGQVLKMNQLKNGVEIYRCHGKLTKLKLKVLGDPFLLENDWWVQVCTSEAGQVFNLSLSDHGVIPDRNGKWEGKYWLEM